MYYLIFMYICVFVHNWNKSATYFEFQFFFFQFQKANLNAYTGDIIINGFNVHKKSTFWNASWFNDIHTHIYINIFGATIGELYLFWC